MVMGYAEPEKKEKKAGSKMSLFFFDSSKDSPYTVDGDSEVKATWQQVDFAVMDAMTERNITWESLAECQRKVPLLIFKLLAELDTCQAQLVERVAKEEKPKK